MYTRKSHILVEDRFRVVAASCIYWAAFCISTNLFCTNWSSYCLLQLLSKSRKRCQALTSPWTRMQPSPSCAMLKEVLLPPQRGPKLVVSSIDNNKLHFARKRNEYLTADIIWSLLKSNVYGMWKIEERLIITRNIGEDKPDGLFITVVGFASKLCPSNQIKIKCKYNSKNPCTIWRGFRSVYFINLIKTTKRTFGFERNQFQTLKL